MKTKYVVLLVAAAFVLLACRCTVFGVTVSVGDEGCSSCNAATSTPAMEERPLIDQMGPEIHFPGMVDGPAIAEIWDGGQYCALVEVHAGETLHWNNPGAYWIAANEEVLGKRFPAHKAEYLRNYPNCQIVLSANDYIPTAK